MPHPSINRVVLSLSRRLSSFCCFSLGREYSTIMLPPPLLCSAYMPFSKYANYSLPSSELPKNGMYVLGEEKCTSSPSGKKISLKRVKARCLVRFLKSFRTALRRASVIKRTPVYLINRRYSFRTYKYWAAHRFCPLPGLGQK